MRTTKSSENIITMQTKMDFHCVGVKSGSGGKFPKKYYLEFTKRSYELSGNMTLGLPMRQR